jgi:Macro domain
MATGVEPKRAVHANRLRVFHDLENDYRLRIQGNGVKLFEHTTQGRKLNVSVTVSNLITTDCLAIVNPANVFLRHDAGAAKTIADAAGESLIKECNEYVSKNGPLQMAQPLVTTSGKLGPATLFCIVWGQTISGRGGMF